MDEKTKLSRRDMFKAGTMLGGLALTPAVISDDVQATHSPDSPFITLGSEANPFAYVFEDNGDLVLQHVDSGAHFFYNDVEDRWQMDEDLQLDTINGENVVKSSEKEYDIQKDGSDSEGVINFKTS